MFSFKNIIDKIRGVDQGEFGMRIITGTFGAGKTKNTFLEAFLWKYDNPDGIIISNIPYKDFDGNNLVDIAFNSKQDLSILLKHLYQYLLDTNNYEYLRSGTFPPVKIIIDESHLYYFSRDFKAFDLEMMTILTQCRKRFITIYYITQELNQLDKFMRRLSPEVIIYTRGPLGLTYKNLCYFKSTEKSDIADEYNVETISSKIIWWDWLRLFFNKGIQKFFDQKFLTYYICGVGNAYHFEYKDFLDYMNKKRQDILDYIKQIEDEKKSNENRSKIARLFKKTVDKSGDNSGTISTETEETNKDI